MQASSEPFRWVVLFVAFLINFFTYGVSFAVGVLYSDWIRYFSSSSGYVGFVGSMLAGFSFTAGPFYGYLIRKFGCRACGMMGGFLMAGGLMASSWAESVTFLLITFGIVSGFGAGLANFAASGGVNFYFIHDRPLAEGVLGGGVCVGMVVFSRMLQLFSHCYTWKGAVLLLGAICLHNSVCSLFLIPSVDINHHHLSCWRKKTLTKENTGSDYGLPVGEALPQQSFLKRSWFLWRCPVFLVILLVDFLAWIAMFVPYVHLVERARHQGIDANIAVWLSSTIGIAGLIGRPLSGFICSHCNMNPFWTYSGFQMFLGCVTILSPLWSTVCGLFVYAITVGLLSNSYGFIKASAVLLLDADRFIDAYSWMMFFEGIGTTLGPLLAGFIFDATDSYDWSFHFSGIILVLSGLLCFLKNPAEKLDYRLSEKSPDRNMNSQNLVTSDHNPKHEDVLWKR